MHYLPDSWNELLDWLYSTPKTAMSEHMQSAKLVTLFHGDVCNGGLYDKLEHETDQYPHAELVRSFKRICGEAANDIIREGLVLLNRPDPAANLSEDARRALSVAVDSISRGADLAKTLKNIASVWPGISRGAGTLAYQAAVAEVIYFEPWEALDRRYFEQGDGVLVEVSRYAEAYAEEWHSQGN
nr:hypothetical protein [Rhodoferax sp.]